MREELRSHSASRVEPLICWQPCRVEAQVAVTVLESLEFAVKQQYDYKATRGKDRNWFGIRADCIRYPRRPMNTARVLRGHIRALACGRIFSLGADAR